MFILTLRNPGKGHQGIFILFSQYFYKSQLHQNFKKIKRWKQVKDNSLPGHFHKNTFNIKNKIPRENVVEDRQNLWEKFKI